MQKEMDVSNMDLFLCIKKNPRNPVEGYLWLPIDNLWTFSELSTQVGPNQDLNIRYEQAQDETITLHHREVTNWAKGLATGKRHRYSEFGLAY